jgi:hypothetical protein
MERLKDWDRVAKLGRQISAELGVDERGDTLSRWMAHRIAELIDVSEKARISELFADRYTRYRSDEGQESPSPWLDALQRLERVHWREEQILLQAALADLDLGDERGALERYGDALGDNELALLQGLTSAQESALAALLSALDEDEAALAAPRRRGEAIAERLQSLAEEREDLVNTVLQGLPESEESKPVKAKRRRQRSGSRKSRDKTRES